MTNSYDVSLLKVSTLSDISELKHYIRCFKYMEKDFNIFASMLNFPISIVYEENYVDRVFRDCYYSFFASKHFDIPKNCQRISLFEGEISLSDFYNEYTSKHLHELFIGTIVIKPLRVGAWGTTLIDPKKLNQKTFYVRTTAYHQIINGVNFTIDAYPFSSQDSEMMSCAETSIWTMLNYYGTRYPEYRTVLPSEIISEVNLSSEQRSLPTLGLNYLQKSNLLKKFGFSPRVYIREIYGDLETKRIFHYYVESGIPLTISLDKHSTVCIGHAKSKTEISSVNNNLIREINGFSFIDSADLHNEYVIIDDNQYPYKIEEYDNFSIHKNSKQLKMFTVPLYKKIFLEANAAKRIFDRVLEALFSGIPDIVSHWGTLSNNNSEPIIERVFLTSSRKFKAFRISTAHNEKESDYYLRLPFPKFLWIMELTISSYYKSNDKKVLGEIILDATASKNSGFESIIAIRIGKIFAYRLPNEKIDDLFMRIHIINEINENINQYINNLHRGGK